MAILAGKTSPAGRLPVTWGKSLADYPATDPKHPERSGKGVDGKTTYSEGVNVGYRWFDKQNIAPLFAFGHGLSYSTFKYGPVRLSTSTLKAGDHQPVQSRLPSALPLLRSDLGIDAIISQKGSDIICVYIAVGQKSSSVRRAIDAISLNQILRGAHLDVHRK